MTWVLLGLWAVAAIAVGLPIARLSLKLESRGAVLTAYGILAGHFSMSLLLVLLWGPLPLGTSYFVVIAVAALASPILFRASSERQPATLADWGISRLDTVIISATLLILAFLGWRLSLVHYGSGNPELLFLHSALVEQMSHESFPAAMPLEPGDTLHYRFAYHSLAAAIRSNVPELPTEVLAGVTGLLLPLLAVALVGVAIRWGTTARVGILAVVVGVFGGSLLPWHTIAGQLVGTGPATLDNRYLIGGMVWGCNTIGCLSGNPTMAAGVVVFFGALWLTTEALVVRHSTWISLITAIIAMSYLGLMNEVYFVLLAAGTVGWQLVALILGRLSRRETKSRRFAESILVVVVAYMVVSFRGGLAGGISLFGSSGNSVQMVLNLDHFGEVPGPRVLPWDYWVPLFTSESAFDTVFAPIGVPLLVGVAIWKGNGPIMPALLACLTGLTAWVFTYSKLSPSDSYRIGQAALTVYITAGPIAVASAFKSPTAGARALHRAAPVLLALLITPHLVATVMQLTSPPAQARLLPTSPDVAASDLLRQNGQLGSMLVPLENPNDNIRALYDSDGPGAAATEILALTGLFVPMGHPNLFNPSGYLPYYQHAGVFFDRPSLDRLKIDWVYVLPAYLNQERMDNLRQAEESGTLRMVKTFGEEGKSSERWLYRVIRKDNGG